MNNDVSPIMSSWISRAASLLLLFAGIIHLIIIPHHWEHAPAHGIFMGIIGVAEINWAVAFWLKPTARLAQIGIVIAIGCIVLRGITREFPAPFGHGPEEVDASGIITKVLELIPALLLIGFIRDLSQPKRDRGWRTVIVVTLLAIFLGFGVYGVARASEPLFPWLMASETHEHEEHEHSPSTEVPATDQTHEHDILPTP
jgi:hypothetical protein